MKINNARVFKRSFTIEKPKSIRTEAVAYLRYNRVDKWELYNFQALC
jgi:hypothetical protein